MTPKQILPFANRITDSNNRTILKMKDNSEIVGFFDFGDYDSMNTNVWRFVKTPINENDRYSLINGIDITSIEIIDLIN
jgi:hypothetical protein